jgi:hypothetical protein
VVGPCEQPPPFNRATSAALSDDVEYETLAGGPALNPSSGSGSGSGGAAGTTAAAERWRIELVYGQHNDNHVIFQAESQAAWAKWVAALEAAAETRHIEDYYTIDYGDELGRGFFADVYVCRPVAHDGRCVPTRT